MNDRFKFRVWSEDYNLYIEDNCYPIGSDFNLSMTQNGYVEVIGMGDYDDDGAFSWGTVESLKECIGDYTVEQCTGLRDKNGKLIYEGDLIKEPANKHNLEVFYENGAWQTREYRKNGNREQLLYVLINCYGVEVIGNIHENADLIKVGGK